MQMRSCKYLVLINIALLMYGIVYGGAPICYVRSPGRVNIIGGILCFEIIVRNVFTLIV